MAGHLYIYPRQGKSTLFARHETVRGGQSRLFLEVREQLALGVEIAPGCLCYSTPRLGIFARAIKNSVEPLGFGHNSMLFDPRQPLTQTLLAECYTGQARSVPI